MPLFSQGLGDRQTRVAFVQWWFMQISHVLWFYSLLKGLCVVCELNYTWFMETERAKT